MTFQDPTFDNSTFDSTAPLFPAAYQPPSAIPTPAAEPVVPAVATEPNRSVRAQTPTQPPTPTPTGYAVTRPAVQRPYQPWSNDPQHNAAQRQINRSEAMRRANRDIGVGVAWLLAGVLITLITYASDMSVYVVAWGPVLYGVIRILKGVFTLRKNKLSE